MWVWIEGSHPERHKNPGPCKTHEHPNRLLRLMLLMVHHPHSQRHQEDVHDLRTCPPEASTLNPTTPNPLVMVARPFDGAPGERLYRTAREDDVAA